MNKVFKLTEDYKGWAKGTLVLEGDEVTPEGPEYFDMSYELKNGWGTSYSHYGIPVELLGEPTADEVDEVQGYLSNPLDYEPKK